MQDYNIHLYNHTVLYVQVFPSEFCAFLLLYITMMYNLYNVTVFHDI